MLITQKNNLLYDTKDFDLYQNVYTIYVDKVTIDKNKEKDLKDYDYLHFKYEQTILKIFYNTDFSNLKNYSNGHKIIFGHFYNNQDYFLYKNLHNGKVIGYKVSKCRLDQLYYNKNNHVLMSHSYKEMVQQLKFLNDKVNKESKTGLSPKTIHYNYEDNLIYFNENPNIFSTTYNDECLSIIHMKKIVIDK